MTENTAGAAGMTTGRQTPSCSPERWDEMGKHWFKPKRYGYGATPTNWKGWAAVAAYVAAVVALTLPLMVWPAEMPAGPKMWQIATWAVFVALLTLAFVRFTRAKTDGQWSWRWGK